MTSDYKVPTSPIEARLILSEGEPEQVTFYLSTVSESHSGVETLDEFLNGERQFLPARSLTTNQPFLVNRDAIVAAEVGVDAPILFKMEGRFASFIDLVQVRLYGDRVVEGTISLVAPPEKARLSDFFNQDETFLPIETSDRVVYINKGRVISVHF